MVGRNIGDRLAIGAALFVAVGIAVNALALQSGPHPAPLFATARPAPAPAPAARPQEAERTASITPRAEAEPAPAQAPAAAPAQARQRTEIVADVQRELARRNLYDGTVDGLTGPKTEAAIKRYEAQARLAVTGEASETLLAHLRRPQRAAASPQPAARPAQPRSIGDLIAAPTPRPQNPAPPRAEAARGQPQAAPQPRSITDLIAAPPPAARPQSAPSGDRRVAAAGRGQ